MYEPAVPGGGGLSASPALAAASASPVDLLRHPRHPTGASGMSPALRSTVHSSLQTRLDVQAEALSVDATGAFAVLAGRRGLHLVDLESPHAPKVTIHHQTKWDVAVAKFHPSAACKSYVASTSNHNTLVWDVASSLSAQGGAYASTFASKQPLVATLRGHSRPVSDLSWAPNEPTLLATGSADAKTHLWDIRTPQRPVQTLHAVTGSAVQVEWHRLDATTLATAHEGEVRVWDTRASDKTPAVLITAHMQKICAIDWHPKRMDELLTCSEDATVKFWSVTHPRVCQGTLSSGAPVGRARYTPFGDGVVTSFHRTDNLLRLWSLKHSAADAAAGGVVSADLVHAFVGHADPVKSFVWRERASSSGNHYQLVSWTKNQELRLTRMDASHLQACGHTPTVTASASLSVNDAEPMDSLVGGFDNFELAQRRAPGLAAASKIDVSALKNDFAPLVVPPAAVPLGASEYSLVKAGSEEKSAVLRALLSFDDDLSKIGHAATSDDEDEDEEDVPNREHASVSTREKAASSTDSETVNMAAVMPCPRIFGACFSGPNVLVMFDSRIALGQMRTTSATPPVAPLVPGKSVKPAVAATVVKKLPRTYEQLLEMRDSRFSKKKNKKGSARLIGGGAAGVGGGAMELSSDWSAVPMDLMDVGAYRVDDSGDHSVHGKRRGGSRGGSGFFTSAVTSPVLEGGVDHEFAVHGGSEYFKTYFSNSEYHLPINHPDHRTSSIQGLSLSPPRTSMAALSGMIRGFGASMTSMVDPRLSGKRGAEQSAVSSLQLDLNLRVALVDLSRLCGVFSFLTYGTQLSSSMAERSNGDDVSSESVKLDAGTQDLYAWMLKATETRRISGRIVGRRTRGGNSFSSPVLSGQKTHPLSRILQSLLGGQEGSRSGSTSNKSVSDICSHNASIACLSGRTDLEQMWSLLELTTASNLQIPLPPQHLQQLQQKTPLAAASSGLAGDTLATTHPWRAHPFGQNLVSKVLAMYEDSGDLPTLASIVCALRPTSAQDESAPNSFQHNRSPGVPVESMVLLGGSSQPGDGNSFTPAMPTVTEASSTLATTTLPGKTTTSPFSKSRTSFNSLTQLLGGQSDSADSVPPVMRSARRSSSHNEVPRLMPASERGESPGVAGMKTGAKDWPMTSRGTASRPNLSANLGPSPSVWKGLDFEKMENPFKTWSSGSTATNIEASSRSLTTDTFRAQNDPLSMSSHRRRGSSIVDSDDETSLAGRVILHVDKMSGDDGHCVLSTDPIDEYRYDGYKEAYAEVLYQYGALQLRSEVLKATAPDSASSTTEDDDDGEPEGLEFGILCRLCQTISNDLYCASCRDFSIKCSLCQLVVRGQSMYCLTCGHGGHEQHMREWFEEESSCPTGCGCWCKQATATVLPSLGGHASLEQLAPVAEGRLQSRSYSF